MSFTSVKTVTIPRVTLTLDELLGVIRQLDEPARIRVAQALIETQMDSKLTWLIEQLAATIPADDISDADIAVEVNAVRQAQI